MKKCISVLSIIILLTTNALGHSWYPKNCCSNKDCAPVPCEDVIAQKDGAYKYLKHFFHKNQVHPSQDSKCHVCIGTMVDDYSGEVQEMPFCVFIQMSF